MQSSAQPQAPRHPRSTRRTGRRRGSVLLLVVVSVVLMTIIGVTYLQVARVDRFAIEQVEYVDGDIDVNVRATRVLIEQILREDIIEIDAAGDAFFLSAQDLDGDDLGDESYDYPWTNAERPGHLDDMWLSSTTPRFDDDNPLGGGYRSALNDPVWPHLTSALDGTLFVNANSNSPEDDQYIVLPENDGGAAPRPETYEERFGLTPAQASSPELLAFWSTDVEVFDEDGATSDPIKNLSEFNAVGDGWDRLGADADQDGIPDARWMYAPVRRVGTTEYVWAVRIIDNSSLLNINTATYLSDGNATASAFDVGTITNLRSPRGYFPTDFDLARLAAVVLRSASGSPITATTFDNELTDWMDARGLAKTNESGNLYYALGLLSGTDSGGDPVLNPDELPAGLNGSASNTFFDDVDSRVAAYLNPDALRSPLFYNSSANRYGDADEIELRHNGGINRSSALTTIETDLIEITRNGTNTYAADTATLAADEMRPAEIAREAVASIGGSPSDDTLALAHYFRGGPDSVEYELREFPSIRQMLTTYNGVGTLTPNNDGSAQNIGTGPGTTGNDPKTRFSLLTGAFSWTAPGAGSYDASDRLDALFDKSSTPHTGHILEVFRLESVDGSRYLDATNDDEADAYAASLATALIDAMDEDSEPTSETVDGVAYYGTEQLPLLREIVIQAGYENSNELDSMGRTSGDAGYMDDGLFETWRLVNNSASIAVELGNPFNQTIDLDEIDVRLVVIQGTNAPVIYNLNALGATIDPAPDVDSGTDESEDQIVVYHNPGTLLDEDDTGSLNGDLASDLIPSGVDSFAITSSSRPFVPTQNDDVTVQLQVDTDSGFVTYDQLVVPWSSVNTVELHPNANYGIDSSDASLIPDVQVDSHVMSVVARDGRGLNYLTNFAGGGFDHDTPASVEDDEVVINRGSIGTTYNSTGATGGRGGAPSIAAIGEDSKSLAGDLVDAAEGFEAAVLGDEAFADVFSERFDLHVPNQPLLHVADIASVFMLGFTTDIATPPNLNASLSQRVTEALIAQPDFVTGAPRYPEWHRFAYLDISPEAKVVDLERDGDGDGTPDTPVGVPHAALLFDRLGIIDPGNDDRNNDGDLDGGTELTDETDPTLGDRRGERLVPGIMNINTVDPLIAALAAPLPEDLNDAEGLFRAIAAYRDHPAVRDTGRGYPDGLPEDDTIPSPDYRPGIASIGELLFVNDPNPLGPNPGVLAPNEGVVQQIARDGNAMNYDRISGLNPSVTVSPETYDRYDVSPMPESQRYYLETDGSTSFARREVTDGPHERIARFRQIANLFSTRSDVFTAYVVIRGYASGAYNQGVVESAHYIAVFDRSGIGEANTPIKLVAYERVF
ncbi:MAG: hypothetical protein AAF823_05445 [Planctomycetota bacterium]